MTRVALFTSHSKNIINTTKTTINNKIEYCLKHDYSFILDCMDYDEAAASTEKLIGLFDRYDLIWCLDMDTIITNMTYKIHKLDCLGPDVTICEEKTFGINCGSMVFKNTDKTKWFLKTITNTRREWEVMGLRWQEWIVRNWPKVKHSITIAPLRSFNSCNLPSCNGQEITDWQEGDFVYHACGAKEKQIPFLNRALQYVKYQ
jgi:hypothetical protein